MQPWKRIIFWLKTWKFAKDNSSQEDIGELVRHDDPETLEELFSPLDQEEFEQTYQDVANAVDKSLSFIFDFRNQAIPGLERQIESITVKELQISSSLNKLEEVCKGPGKKSILKVFHTCAVPPTAHFWYLYILEWIVYMFLILLLYQPSASTL